MFTTTNDDGNIPEYPGPTDTHIDTLRATQAGFCQALITRAEAVTSIVTPLLTPVEPADIPTGDAFYRDENANPNRRNSVKTKHASEPHTRHEQDASAGERSLPAGFIRVSGVGVVRVADVAELRENLPMSVEAVLATVLDCTRMHVSSRVREILTLTLLMPNVWVHVKTGAIPFERASYAAYRAVKANVDIPAFDELLAASRLNVSITTFRKMVGDIIATLTTPVEVNRNAHENRRVRLLKGVAGESTITITGPTITVEAMYKRFTATARSIQKNLLTHFTTHPTNQCGPVCTHPTTCTCTYCHTPDCATHTDSPCTCNTSGHANTASGRATDAFGLPVNDADVSVGELGVVEEILDTRLFDQLVFDVVDGARPSTTVTARVIPTNASKPATVREESPTLKTGFMDRWEDRNETTEAQAVREMRLCVSMPTSAEWLKSQACLNIMIPFMHLLPNNGTTTPATNCPTRNTTGATVATPGGNTTTANTVTTTSTAAGTVGHSGNRAGTGGNHRSSPGHDGGISPDSDVNQGTASRRTETSPDTGTPPPDTGTTAPPPGQRFPVNAGDTVAARTDNPPGAKHTPSHTNTPDNPGEPDLAHQKTDTSDHQGRSGPSGGVPVMVNNRFSLDPYTTDQLLEGASWVYRYFTDPTTGTVTEALPMRYQVPKALKFMLEARWETCSVPWCSTPARVCEKDHIQPFNHRDPANGGLTVAENLHPLCKRHHQAKTEGRISVTRTPDGGVEWEFPSVGRVLSYPPESLVQQDHYRHLQKYVTTSASNERPAQASGSNGFTTSVKSSVYGTSSAGASERITGERVWSPTNGPEHTIAYDPNEVALELCVEAAREAKREAEQETKHQTKSPAAGSAKSTIGLGAEQQANPIAENVTNCAVANSANSATRSPVPELELTPDPDDDPPPF